MLSGRQTVGLHLVDRRQRQIGVDGAGAVRCEQRKMMHFAGLAGFDDQAAASARLVADQMMMHGARGQQGRDRHPSGIDAAIGENQDRRPRVQGSRRFAAQLFQPAAHSFDALGPRKQDRKRVATEPGGTRLRGVAVQALDLRHFGVGQNRLLEPEQATLLRSLFEQIPFGADRGDQRRDDLLADRVERRVGHLREQLLEIVVEQLRTVGEDGQRRVVAHRADRLLAIGTHRPDEDSQIFQRVAERALQFQQRTIVPAVAVANGRCCRWHENDRDRCGHRCRQPLPADRSA